MQIVIDPTSLQQTASVLRGAADALGEICSRVTGEVSGVYAPPSVASYADSVTASASSTIHNVIYELLDEAADLERRASCCCADQSTSLPVPALVGMAFGGAALSAASQVQMGSAVGPVAASGPGMAMPAAAPIAAAPVAAPVAPVPMSLQEVLGSATLGGSSPVGSGITMVYDPTIDPNAPRFGVTMVPDPSYNLVPARVGMTVGNSGSAIDSILRDQQVFRPYTLTGRNSLFGVGFLGMDSYG